MTKLTEKEILNILNKANNIKWYAKDVFKYDNKHAAQYRITENNDYEKIDPDFIVNQKNGSWTLIQEGEILVEDADWVRWEGKDVFTYKKDNITILSEVKND
jgi:hypothetical protein